MSDCQEHIKRQIAIVKAVNNFGISRSQEWKLEVFRQVNKWLVSDRITNEKKNGYRGKYK